MKSLLLAALFALNSMPNRRLKHPKFKDTYMLAAAIEWRLGLNTGVTEVAGTPK